MGGAPLHVTRSDHDGSTLVHVAGEIDLSTASQFQRELLTAAQGNESLLVDLRDVDFMDSTGIGVLVRTSKKVTSAGGEMRLVCGPGPVLRVLEVSGLIGVIPVQAELDSAGDS